MNKPHILAEVIKKWADGFPIQWRASSINPWQNLTSNAPAWTPTNQYRVKPETFKFRLFKWRSGIITAVIPEEEGCYIQREIEQHGKFITDWVEVDLI